MATENVNVRVTRELRNHLQQQQTWNWLKQELEPALRADESAYITVTADDVIARNKNT